MDHFPGYLHTSTNKEIGRKENTIFVYVSIFYFYNYSSFKLDSDCPDKYPENVTLKHI